MNRKIPVIAAAAAAVIVTTVLLVRRGGESDVITASGTVEATEADLGFQTAGRIVRIVAREGEAVSAGSEIALLDDADLQARRALAQAQVMSARAQLTELQRGARPEEVAQARAAAHAARERMEDARRALDRTGRLEAGGAVSRESLDAARTMFEVTQAQYQQANEQLRLVEAGPRAERITAQQGVLQQAKAMLEQVDAGIAYAKILAPFSGVVSVRHREPGEVVAAGLPVVSLLNPQDRWVRIYVREDQIGNVRIDTPAEIRSDTDPERAVRGRVVYIASEAEFTPRNVQTTEERVKLVYAVKVAITGDAEQMLKPGMPADVVLLNER